MREIEQTTACTVQQSGIRDDIIFVIYGYVGNALEVSHVGGNPLKIQQTNIKENPYSVSS